MTRNYVYFESVGKSITLSLFSSFYLFIFFPSSFLDFGRHFLILGLFMSQMVLKTFPGHNILFIFGCWMRLVFLSLYMIWFSPSHVGWREFLLATGKYPVVLFISDRNRIPINGLREIRRVTLPPARRREGKDISVWTVVTLIFRQNFRMIDLIPCKKSWIMKIYSVLLYLEIFLCL